MDKILKPADIAERYGVGLCTARAYMRKMIHMENPLAVTESALMQWERERTTAPGMTARAEPARMAGRKSRKAPPAPATPKGKFIISRVREVTP